MLLLDFPLLASVSFHSYNGLIGNTRNGRLRSVTPMTTCTATPGGNRPCFDYYHDRVLPKLCSWWIGICLAKTVVVSQFMSQESAMG